MSVFSTLLLASTKGPGPIPTDHDIQGYSTLINDTFDIKFNSGMGANERTVTVSTDSNGYWYCDSPSDVTITSLDLLFYSGRSHLTRISFGDSFDTSSVTDMSGMFNSCSSLTSIDVSGLDTSNVTSMNGMFNDCSSLTSIDVSGLDTSSVTDMSYMFSGCSSLTSIDVSGFNTSNVTGMSAMFSGCSSLTSIDVSGLDTSSVTDMSYMFDGCTQLNANNIDFMAPLCTNMSYMFNNCYSQAIIPHITTSSACTDMNHMFSNCTSLSRYNNVDYDTSGVLNIAYMFYGCTGIVNLNLTNCYLNSVDVTNQTKYVSFVPNMSTITVQYTSGSIPSEIRAQFPNVNWVAV